MNYNELRLKEAFKTSEEVFFYEVYRQTRMIKPKNMMDIIEIVDLLQILKRAKNKIEDSKFLKREFRDDTVLYYGGMKLRLIEIIGFKDIFNLLEE